MATKKAKKTTKKSTTPAPKVTTTVVSKAAPAKKLSYWGRLNSIKDIDSIFSAKTLSLLFVEMIGAMAMAIIFSYVQGNQLFMMLSLGALILAFSGFAITFFNPIITIGAWLAEKVSTKKMILAVIAQLLGTMLAVVLLSTFINAAPAPAQDTPYQAAAPAIHKIAALPENNQWFVFGAELLGATILGFMAAQAFKRTNGEKAVTVCGASFIAILVAGALVSTIGAATLLNPAMSILALDFAKDSWQWNVAVYVLAPIIGGIIGFMIDKVLAKSSTVKTIIKA